MGDILATPIFKCNKCGHLIDLDDIDRELFCDYLHELEEECEEHTYSAWDVLIFDPYGGTKFIYPTGNNGWYSDDSMADALIDHIHPCPKCEIDLELKVWCWFEASFDAHQPWKAYYVEHVDDGLTIDIKNASMQDHYGIYKGKIIREFIRYFFYRWSALDYEFVIIIPFIDVYVWIKILKEIYELHNSSFANNIKTKLFLIRESKWGDKIGIKGFEKLRKQYCSKCDDKYGYYEPPCFDGYCFWDSSFKIPLIKDVRVAKKNFHAKLIAGISPKNEVECIQTSYNFIVAETHQYETFDLRIIPYKEFEKKFLNPINDII